MATQSSVKGGAPLQTQETGRFFGPKVVEDARLRPDGLRPMVDLDQWSIWTNGRLRPIRLRPIWPKSSIFVCGVWCCVLMCVGPRFWCFPEPPSPEIPRTPSPGPPEPPSPGLPLPDPPPLDRPKFRSFCSPLPPPFSLLFPLLAVLSLNFGGVFEGRDTEMCTFGLSGCRVKPRRLWEETDFGQSRFGHPDLANFRQSNFG